MCDGLTNAPAQAQLEPVQAKPPSKNNPVEFERTRAINEINIGLDDLRLNAGQRKEYVMRVLELRTSIEVEKCTDDQLKALVAQLGDDLW